MATIDECTATGGDALAFAREHGLAGRVDLDAVATILNNPAADERTAGLLALGFCAGYAACQNRDGDNRTSTA
jgi:hypothetical protein